MPFYEFLCLAKPSLAKPHLARMMARVGDIVLGDGGIVTNVVSYGEHSLAYDIRKPFQRHEKVMIMTTSSSDIQLMIGMANSGVHLANELHRQARYAGESRSRSEAE